MNYKLGLNLVFIILLTSNIVSCAFVPKTVSRSATNKPYCKMSTRDWEVEVIPIDFSGNYCFDELCAAVILAVPIVTAAFTLPIVIIGDSIHYIEEKIRCN